MRLCRQLGCCPGDARLPVHECRGHMCFSVVHDLCHRGAKTETLDYAAVEAALLRLGGARYGAWAPASCSELGEGCAEVCRKPDRIGWCSIRWYSLCFGALVVCRAAGTAA